MDLEDGIMRSEAANLEITKTNDAEMQKDGITDPDLLMTVIMKGARIIHNRSRAPAISRQFKQCRRKYAHWSNVWRDWKMNEATEATPVTGNILVNTVNASALVIAGVIEINDHKVNYTCTGSSQSSCIIRFNWQASRSSC